MNSKEITALALRIFAIYVLADLFIDVGSFAGVFWESAFNKIEGPPALFRVYAVSTVATVIVGSVLAYFLLKLSNSALNRVPDSDQAMDGGLQKSFFISLLGLYFIVSALGQLPYWFAVDSEQGPDIAKTLYLLRHLFTLLAGLILVAMPNRISKILSKVGA